MKVRDCVDMLTLVDHDPHVQNHVDATLMVCILNMKRLLFM